MNVILCKRVGLFIVQEWVIYPRIQLEIPGTLYF